jgi:hypothetical protein
MMRSKRLISLAGCVALIVAGCEGAPSKITAYEAASPETLQVIDRYVADVQGRFGALAISADGSRATYYVCQLRVWKNCDNYELNNFASIPSGHVAAKIAMSRCGSECRLLYINDERQD